MRSIGCMKSRRGDQPVDIVHHMVSKKALSGLCVALWLIVGCRALPTQGEILSSGITGKVLLGPQCPPIFPDLKKESCEDKPYQATVIVKTEDEFREVTLFSSDRRGEFRVGLRPGTYRLEPLPRGFTYPSPDTQIVKVEPGKFANVKILYDTGIR